VVEGIAAQERGGRWRKPPRLYEGVARDLAQAIMDGRYAPGDFLPTEQALAAEYGTSRNVIREALKVLSARMLIEIHHGRGAAVLPRHRWQLLDQLVHLVQEDQEVPHNLLELRRILEVEIAGLAAQRANREHVAAMRETLAAMQATAAAPLECIEHDIGFHRVLAEAAGNPLMPLVLEPVAQLLRASRVATIHNPGAVERSVEAHRQILERVEARDDEGARAAMRRHLLQVEGEIRRIHDAVDEQARAEAGAAGHEARPADRRS
jgi:DNA-binding FadR family transcriptional regulator